MKTEEQIYTLTCEQMKAVQGLWDASDSFAEDPDIMSVEQDDLIAARDAMGQAFPISHPIYGKLLSNPKPEGEEQTRMQ